MKACVAQAHSIIDLTSTMSPHGWITHMWRWTTLPNYLEMTKV